MSLIEQRISNHLNNGGIGFYIKSDKYTMDVRGGGESWSVSIWQGEQIVCMHKLHNRSMLIGRVGILFAQETYSTLTIQTY